MSRLAMSALAALLGALPMTLARSAPARADARSDCFSMSGDAAIRACTEAIAREPGDAVSYVNRAYEYQQKSDYARSLADYSKAIEIDPARWDSLQGRAWALLKLGRPDEALRDADASLRIKANVAQTLDTRAHILEALQRREEAITDFRRALAIEPRLQGSRDGLKRLGAAP